MTPNKVPAADKVVKNFAAQLADLAIHAKLLSEACDRFFNAHSFDEIKNIGVRLRVLVGNKVGDGLLFALADETRDRFNVVMLNQRGRISIEERHNVTGELLQKVVKEAIITQMPGRLPVVLAPTATSSLYVNRDLKDWIENGFLLDWDVPKEGATPMIASFTPQRLIERYAGQEAAHSDRNYGAFGQPIEAFTMTYQWRDQSITVPVVYEYLAQIGVAVAAIALQFVEDKATKPTT